MFYIKALSTVRAHIFIRLDQTYSCTHHILRECMDYKQQRKNTQKLLGEAVRGWVLPHRRTVYIPLSQNLKLQSSFWLSIRPFKIPLKTTARRV